MQLLREITIAGMAADPDWVGDETLELADSNFMRLSPGWTGIEWVLLYADGNGKKVGASAGTINTQVVFKRPSAEGVAAGTAENKYSAGASTTGTAVGDIVLAGGAGGRTLRPSVLATVRMTAAIAGAPAAAAKLQVWAQEV